MLVCLGIALGGLVGCGTDVSGARSIEGDESFAGMPNPGSIGEAIERFGHPDEMFAPAESGSHECIARWHEEGIDAQFIEWGAIGEEVRPCQVRPNLTLTHVTLRGDWETDSGLRTGDGMARLEELYDPGPVGSCAGYVGPDEARMLREVADPLGGPGSYLCTLGVVVAGGEVTAFVMSSLAASE